MIITDKKKFGWLLAYIVAALAGTTFNVWIAFTISSYSIAAAGICLFFAIFVGSDITSTVEFPPKEKNPLL